MKFQFEIRSLKGWNEPLCAGAVFLLSAQSFRDGSNMHNKNMADADISDIEQDGDNSDISLEMDVSSSDSGTDSDSDEETFHDAIDHIHGNGYMYEPDAPLGDTEMEDVQVDIGDGANSEDEDGDPVRLLSNAW